MRRICGGAVIVCVAIVLAAPASAGPTAADFQVFVTTGTSRFDQMVPPGGTASFNRLRFKAGAIVDNDGGEEATARLRFTLPAGLRFGDDGPDPTESCTGTATTGDCDTGITIGTDPSRRSVAWSWDIEAAAPGRYELRAEIVATSVPDPQPSSNATTVTVVITSPSGGGGAGATVSASAVRLAPAKPRAGGIVNATVRVTVDGSAARPTGVACTGAIGTAKVKGTPRAISGTAACSYRPPASARGKALRGSISFSAGEQRLTRRFSAKLG